MVGVLVGVGLGLGPEKKFVPEKIFGPEKIVGPKKILGPKKNLGPETLAIGGWVVVTMVENNAFSCPTHRLVPQG